MNKTSPALAQGFTLIEMTVVLLLITLLASVAIRETNSLSFQVRYEQTQERLERIREAILGNPRQIINGQQAISGFVADMGRLPMDLHELLERDFCPDRNYSKDDCEEPLRTQPQWAYDPASGLWSGWRGPYLNISGSALDDDAFVDGWGNAAATKTDQNYGWWFLDLSDLTSNELDRGNLIIQSFGKNQKKDDSIPTNGNYENDYPSNNHSNGTVFYPDPIVRQQDWKVDISGGITVNLLKPYQSLGESSYSSKNICMNIFYRANGALKYASSSHLTIEENGSYQELRFLNFKDQDDNDATPIPIGQNAIGIYEYDGDCDPVNNPLYPADRQNPIQVDFHPRTGLPVINW